MSTPSDPQNCPDCASAMEPGFLTSQDSGIYWAEHEKEGRILAAMAEPLTPAPGHFPNPKYPAWRCRKCGMFLFRQNAEP